MQSTSDCGMMGIGFNWRGLQRCIRSLISRISTPLSAHRGRSYHDVEAISRLVATHAKLQEACISYVTDNSLQCCVRDVGRRCGYRDVSAPWNWKLSWDSLGIDALLGDFSSFRRRCRIVCPTGKDKYCATWRRAIIY